jgi:nitrite reductase/ring-hydroxylating ferredoxin subunit
MFTCGKTLVAFYAALALLGAGCSKNSAQMNESSPVPNVSVNVSININNNAYSGLKTVGNVVYLTNVGNRGILVYRFSASGSQQIVAFDRTCPYDLPDNGGIVFSQYNNTAVCQDCSSTYDLTNGNVVSGPSTIGIKQYNVSFNASTGAVTITN